MKSVQKLFRLLVLVTLLTSTFIAFASGIEFKIPVFNLQNLLRPRPQSPQHHPHPRPHHQTHYQTHHNFPQRTPPQPEYGLELEQPQHSATDERGAFYLHDPSSIVNFYFKENLHGPSKRVDIHHDGCRDVPKDYWHQKPKSLWAKHCITLYQNGYCHGEGVQVAGMVHELRSAGMHYGVTSFKPCEKNIRIRFVSPSDNKLHRGKW